MARKLLAFCPRCEQDFNDRPKAGHFLSDLDRHVLVCLAEVA